VIILAILFGILTFKQLTIFGMETNRTKLESEKQNVLNQVDQKDKEIQDLKNQIQEKDIQINNYQNRSYKRLDIDATNLVAKYSAVYQVDRTLLECVVNNESGGNPYAIGDSRNAVGTAQYHLGTFKSHRKQMGLSTADLRTDADESMKTMTWAIAKGYGPAWTAYRNCTNFTD